MSVSKQALTQAGRENVFLLVNSPTSLCDAKETRSIEGEGLGKWSNIIIFSLRIEGTFEGKG